MAERRLARRDVESTGDHNMPDCHNTSTLSRGRLICTSLETPSRKASIFLSSSRAMAITVSLSCSRYAARG